MTFLGWGLEGSSTAMSNSHEVVMLKAIPLSSWTSFSGVKRRTVFVGEGEGKGCLRDFSWIDLVPVVGYLPIM